MAQPQPETNNLIDEIEGLRTRDQRDDFSLRRIELKGEALLKVDAADGYMILGMVACLREAADDCRQNHERSVRLPNADRHHYQNYATSLRTLGFLHESAETLRVTMNRFGESGEDIVSLAECLASMGRYVDAIELCEGYLDAEAEDGGSMLTDEQRGTLSELREKAVKNRDLMERYGISQADVETALRMTLELMHQRGVYSSGLTQERVGDEAGEWLRILPNPRSVDKKTLWDLEEALLEEIGERDFPAFDSGFAVVRFV